MKRSILVCFIVALSVCLSVALCGCENAEAFTVSFETFGGTEYVPVQAYEGDTVVLKTPERPGYVFGGWFDSDKFDGEKLADEVTVTKDVTFYAKWEELHFTVEFVSNGGTEYEPVVSNGRTIVLPEPLREGYTFDGWYSNEDLSGDKLGERLSPSADVTIYAAWTQKELIEVSFETFGAQTIAPVAVESSSVVELPVPQQYGYEFLGWFSDPDFEGECLQETFRPLVDTMLYAKWDKVTYIYLYYGTSTESIRLSYHDGDIISVSELPEPEPVVVRGAQCPFVKWSYDGLTPEDVGNTIVVGEDDVYLIPTYDYSLVPPLEYAVQNEDGSWSTTGKVVKILENADKQEGSFSINVTVEKVAGTGGGSAEVAFRITHSGADYGYETPGMYFLMAGISPSGYIQIHRVTDGKWSNIKRYNLVDAPLNWQNKFNSTPVGGKITANLMVADYGDRFEIYLDGELIYENSDAALLAQFVGTGFGFRSNAKAGTTFSDWEYKASAYTTVSFETFGGSEIEPVIYSAGRLNVKDPIKQDKIFDGWYYDSELTRAVDIDSLVFDGDKIILYAKWKDAEYIDQFVEFDSENWL